MLVKEKPGIPAIEDVVDWFPIEIQLRDGVREKKH